MIAKANFKYGDASYQFEVEEKDTKETLVQIITLANPPRYCPLCKKSDDKTLSGNKDREGNVYVKVLCPCGAQSNLGSYKSGGYFWHDFIIPTFNKDNK